MTLLAKGLPNDVPDAFITSDMSVSVLPNISNPLSRPPLQPTTPLPWPDCYHPTQAMTRCRMRNDAINGGDWPDPKYRLTGWDQILLAQTYFSEDGERRVTMKREQEPSKASTDASGEDISTDQLEDCQASPITRPVPDAESRYCPSVSEAGSGYAPSISVVGSRCSDAGSQISVQPAQKAKPDRHLLSCPPSFAPCLPDVFPAYRVYGQTSMTMR